MLVEGPLLSNVAFSGKSLSSLKTMTASSNILRRYTDLPALLAVLRNQEITLLPPSTWDDKNDRNLMDAYKRAKGLKTLVALCFSQCPETYHHWKIFAPGSSGVCIEFEKIDLLSCLPKTGIVHDIIDYKTISQLRNSRLDVTDLPFTKRAAFADEKEYRIVFTSRRLTLPTKRIAVPISAIHRVAINPWVAEPLFDAVEETIRSIPGCDRLTVYHSKLIESPSWKSYAGKYA
jgi:hypothetical protein